MGQGTFSERERERERERSMVKRLDLIFFPNVVVHCIDIYADDCRRTERQTGLKFDGLRHTKKLKYRRVIDNYTIENNCETSEHL